MLIKKIFLYQKAINKEEVYDDVFGFREESRKHNDTAQGQFLAHDIVDHPKTIKKNPVIDELYALGILLMTRSLYHYNSPWSTPDVTYADNLFITFRDMEYFNNSTALFDFNFATLTHISSSMKSKLNKKINETYLDDFLIQSIKDGIIKCRESLHIEYHQDFEDDLEYEQTLKDRIELFLENAYYYSIKGAFYYYTMYKEDRGFTRFYDKLIKELTFMERQADEGGKLKVRFDTLELSASLKLYNHYDKLQIKRIVN